MKWLWSLCVLTFFFFGTTVTAADSATGDEVWAGIVRDAKGAKRSELADRLKAFYKAYPEHPRAMDAWIKEQSLRQQTGEAPKAEAASNVFPKLAEAATPDFQAELADAKRRILLARSAGPAAEAAELEHSARRLIKGFPKENIGWEFLLQAAHGMGKEKATQFYTEVSAKAPRAELRAEANSRLVLTEMSKKVVAGPDFIAPPGDGVLQAKVAQMAFTAIDGRPVNMRSLAGKVVLVDFWATWCGPCLMELPHVKEAYAQFHQQGFEIVGVSLDRDQNALKRFLASNQMEWPQYCDGRAWQSGMAKNFGVNAIPTMYLVDKKGRLRDLAAQDSLAGKIRFLLAEE